LLSSSWQSTIAALWRRSKMKLSSSRDLCALIIYSHSSCQHTALLSEGHCSWRLGHSIPLVTNWALGHTKWALGHSMGPWPLTGPWSQHGPLATERPLATQMAPSPQHGPLASQRPLVTAWALGHSKALGHTNGPLATAWALGHSTALGQSHALGRTNVIERYFITTGGGVTSACRLAPPR
jgi:hypothetical protein